MSTEKILVEKLELPEGVNRQTHFLAIRKDLSVVAIEKTPEMMKKAVETRKAKLLVKKARSDKNKNLAIEKAQRKTKRDEIKAMKDEYKVSMEKLRKEQTLQKEMLKSKLAKTK